MVMETGIPAHDTVQTEVQSVLDATGQGLHVGNFEDFARYFALPYTVDTFEEAITVQDALSLRNLFNTARDYYARIGLVHLLRTVLDAAYRSDGTLSATYETHLITREGTQTRAPYLCHVELSKTADFWQVYRTQYAIDDNAHLVSALLGQSPMHARRAAG
ncbi:hypothetical protein [Primorskyibacter sp. S187A]|uniref:hypothetical protein n=1 Tax=Primorskyibacter sp. S187A TaxID=3415130 RepID=UPI003C7B578E